MTETDITLGIYILSSFYCPSLNSIHFISLPVYKKNSLLNFHQDLKMIKSLKYAYINVDYFNGTEVTIYSTNCIPQRQVMTSQINIGRYKNSYAVISVNLFASCCET